VKAFTQPLTGVIRVGPDTSEYGKDWDYAVTYSSVEPTTCTLLALKGDGKVSTAHRRAVMAEVRRLGFYHVKWERHKKAGTRDVDVKLD
jgi:hypothetical protein